MTWEYHFFNCNTATLQQVHHFLHQMPCFCLKIAKMRQKGSEMRQIIEKFFVSSATKNDEKTSPFRLIKTPLQTSFFEKIDTFRSLFRHFPSHTIGVNQISGTRFGIWNQEKFSGKRCEMHKKTGWKFAYLAKTGYLCTIKRLSQKKAEVMLKI